MADDYGDDSGQRLYDMIVRAGTVAAERSGLSARDGAMGETAARIEEALSALRRHDCHPLSFTGGNQAASGCEACDSSNSSGLM